MRVVTFNICHASRGRGTAVDNDAVVAACVDLAPDVLALQEVDRGVRRSGRVDQTALVADACGMASTFVAAQRLGGGDYGNALLVRGDVREVERLSFTGRWRWGPRDRRAALVAEVIVDGLGAEPIGERPMDTALVPAKPDHGEPDGGPTHPRRSLAMTVAVAHLSLAVLDNVPQERLVLERLVRRPGPHLLVGDLNRRTGWVRSSAERAGLALVDDDEPTSPAARPRFRIDHVATSGFDVVSIEVVDTGVSDHRALVVDLAPRPSGAPGREPH